DTGLNVQARAGKVDPAVVDINTFQSGLFGLPSGSQTRPLGAGTGMIVTSSGEILTNNHVIAGATRISVTVPGHDGTYTAKVDGADPTDDVALLQIRGLSGLPTV